MKTTPFRKKFAINSKWALFLSNVPHAWGHTRHEHRVHLTDQKKVGLHALHHVHVISHVK